MFNLEQAIKKWRKDLENHPGLEPGYIEELESHLRDKVEVLKTKGFSEEEAFNKAVQQFDNPEEIAGEYHKARSRKSGTPPWKHSGWVPAMLPNYIKMAVRGFQKQKQFAIINILGLSIGLACCLLIFLYIFQQLQYDRFHPEPDQLYRITYEVTENDNAQHYAVSVPGLTPALQESFPEIEEAVRISTAEELTIEADGRLFNEEKFFHADSTFFDIFGFRLVQGDPQNTLSGPNKIVLSEQTAEKYFGETNPIGKTISVDYNQQTTELKVSGVATESSQPSHFSFDLLASFETLKNIYPTVNDDNWWLRSVYSYVKLSDPQNKENVQNRLPNIVEYNMQDMMERSGSSYAFHLQPVTDIHLYSHLQQEIQPNGNILYVYLFGSVAFLVLLIACFNYMNLATAQYARRAKEVGIRKTMGADRPGLIQQFVGESLVFSLLAILLAVLMAWFALPLLEQFTGQSIQLTGSNLKWIVLSLPLIWLITGILSGSYPAFFLSSFEPSHILKGIFRQKTSGANLRKTLVVIQYAISAVLIIGTGIIYMQLNYAENKPLGFERDQVVVIPNSSSLFTTAEPATVQQKIEAHSSIRNVAFGSHYPTHVLSNNTMVRPEGAAEDDRYNITLNNITPSYQEVLQLNLAEGRNFSSTFATDSAAFVINETAADYFGWSDPIGKEIFNVTDGELMGEVIGVFQDFHVQPLYEQIEPIIFSLGPADRYNYTLVKIDGQYVSSTLDYLENQWGILQPDYPFEYSFLDSQYEAQYHSEQLLGQLILTFSILAIFIACLGLFGLAAYATQQRTKEIGIRKALGASIFSITTLLSKDFLKLILISFIIAVPIGWIAAHQWLQRFAYHIEIGIGIFLVTGLIVLMIALSTVSWQAIKAATMNPVKSLRSE